MESVIRKPSFGCLSAFRNDIQDLSRKVSIMCNYSVTEKKRSIYVDSLRRLTKIINNMIIKSTVSALFSLVAAVIPLRGQIFSPAAPAPQPRLNVLLVVADDLGVQVGCYGDAIARTPEIDRLAAEGMRFETAYVAQASCSPSRSAILTGLFPHQNGQLGLANRGYAMYEGIRTLPAMLQSVHYRTGIIGKLHVDPEEDFPFDYADKNVQATRYVREVVEKADRFWSEDPNRPWFLMINYSDPHVPFDDQIDDVPEKPYTATDMVPFPFQQINTPEQLRHISGYYNGVKRVDFGLGLLLRRLAANGQADRTVVVFIGDHGAPFVRAKTTSTEAGLRIPFIVRWPDITDGTPSSALVSTVDLVPTFRAAAGLPADRSLPGRSLLPVLRRADFPLRSFLFAEYNAHVPAMYFPQRVVRDERYKLILNLEDERAYGVEVDGDPAAKVLTDPKWRGSLAQQALQFLRNPPSEELYDLEVDPQEFTNVIDRPQHGEVLVRLRTALQTWRETTGDPLLDPYLRATEKARHTDAPSSFDSK